MIITKEEKQNYIDKIYKEMQRCGLTEEEIPRVIAKTGFVNYPDPKGIRAC